MTILVKERKAPFLDRAENRQLLPFSNAFVVQFGAETDARLGTVAERIEHLQTGRRSRFASIDDLLAFDSPLDRVFHRRLSQRTPNSVGGPRTCRTFEAAVTTESQCTEGVEMKHVGFIDHTMGGAT